MTTIKTMVRARAPSDIPDGAEVTLTIAESHNGDVLSAEESARILADMQRLEPWVVPDEVESDLADWERKIDISGKD